MIHRGVVGRLEGVQGRVQASAKETLQHDKMGASSTHLIWMLVRRNADETSRQGMSAMVETMASSSST